MESVEHLRLVLLPANALHGAHVFEPQAALLILAGQPVPLPLQTIEVRLVLVPVWNLDKDLLDLSAFQWSLTAPFTATAWVVVDVQDGHHAIDEAAPYSKMKELMVHEYL